MTPETNLRPAPLRYWRQPPPRRAPKRLPVKELAQLAELYSVRSPSEIVSEFLAENRYLVKLLKEARRQIAHYFGAETKPSLELVYIPETDILDKIWVLIPTKLDVEPALALLDRFDEEWWLDALVEAKDNMNIKLEYVR